MSYHTERKAVYLSQIAGTQRLDITLLQTKTGSQNKTDATTRRPICNYHLRPDLTLPTSNLTIVRTMWRLSSIIPLIVSKLWLVLPQKPYSQWPVFSIQALARIYSTRISYRYLERIHWIDRIAAIANDKWQGHESRRHRAIAHSNWWPMRTPLILECSKILPLMYCSERRLWIDAYAGYSQGSEKLSLGIWGQCWQLRRRRRSIR